MRPSDLSPIPPSAHNLRARRALNNLIYVVPSLDCQRASTTQIRRISFAAAHRSANVERDSTSHVGPGDVNSADRLAWPIPGHSFGSRHRGLVLAPREAGVLGIGLPDGKASGENGVADTAILI